jgi:hypothetical protein
MPIIRIVESLRLSKPLIIKIVMLNSYTVVVVVVPDGGEVVVVVARGSGLLPSSETAIPSMLESTDAGATTESLSPAVNVKSAGEVIAAVVAEDAKVIVPF